MKAKASYILGCMMNGFMAESESAIPIQILQASNVEAMFLLLAQ
jgi:hypothetical protein